MTNLEWIRTLSEEEFADWLYDEWLHHLQYRWSSSRGGLIIWLKDRKDEPTISKMEQVEDEPQTCSVNGRPYDCGNCEYHKCTADEPHIVGKHADVIIIDEPQTDTETAKAIVHKMIDDAVIAEDAYPDLRQRMHDAVDNYEPQTGSEQ